MIESRRTIAWNTASALVTQATSASFTAVLTLYLTRALGPTGYGVLGLAGAVGGLLMLPADFGISQSASRYVAENRDDPSVVAGVMSAAVRLKLSLTVGVGVLLFALSPAIAAAYGIHGLVWPIRAVAISIVAQSFMTTFCYGLISLARTSLNIPIYLVQSVLETGLGIALVVMGGGAAGAIFGRAIGYVVAALIAAFIVARVLGEPLAPRSATARRWTRSVLRYGGALMIVDSAFTIFNQVDALLIGLLLNAHAVGLYAAPFRILGFLGLPANAVSAGIAPRMTVAGREGPQARYLVGGAQLVAYVQMAALPPLILWSTPIARKLFTDDFAQSGSVLRAFTPFVFLLGFGLLFSVVANYLGQARARVPVAIATTVVNIVADLILIPRVGVVGGAIGTDIAYAFYAPAHVWICRRSVSFSLAPLGRACVRGAFAAAVMGGVMVLVVGTSPSLAAMFGGYALGLCAYALVLFISGALSELKRLRGPDGWTTIDR